MFSKIRSLIFKLDPELAHSLAIKALKFNYFPKINLRALIAKSCAVSGSNLNINDLIFENIR